MSGRMLSPTEIAERLSISRTTVYKLIHNGYLPGIVTLGPSLYRMAESTLDRFLAGEITAPNTDRASA